MLSRKPTNSIPCTDIDRRTPDVMRSRRDMMIFGDSDASRGSLFFPALLLRLISNDQDLKLILPRASSRAAFAPITSLPPPRSSKKRAGEGHDSRSTKVKLERDSSVSVKPESDEEDRSGLSATPPTSPGASVDESVKAEDIKPAQASALDVKPERQRSPRRDLGRKNKAPSPEQKDTLKAAVVPGSPLPQDPGPAGVRARPNAQFNIFDITTMDFAQTGPGTTVPASLLSERHFLRADLGGPPMGFCHSRSSNTRHHDTLRITMFASLNIQCTSPGQPLIWAGRDPGELTEAGNLTSFFIAEERADVKRHSDRDGWTSQKGEKWRAYGNYEVAFTGVPEPGEFSRASAAAQERVVECFTSYWMKKKQHTFMQETWMFTKPSPAIMALKGQAKREAIAGVVRADLLAGRGVGVTYTAFRYVDANAAEVAEVVARRNERR